MNAPQHLKLLQENVVPAKLAGRDQIDPRLVATRRPLVGWSPPIQMALVGLQATPQSSPGTSPAVLEALQSSINTPIQYKIFKDQPPQEIAELLSLYRTQEIAQKLQLALGEPLKPPAAEVKKEVWDKILALAEKVDPKIKDKYRMYSEENLSKLIVSETPKIMAPHGIAVMFELHLEGEKGNLSWIQPKFFTVQKLEEKESVTAKGEKKTIKVAEVSPTSDLQILVAKNNRLQQIVLGSADAFAGAGHAHIIEGSAEGAAQRFAAERQVLKVEKLPPEEFLLNAMRGTIESGVKIPFNRREPQDLLKVAALILRLRAASLLNKDKLDEGDARQLILDHETGHLLDNGEIKRPGAQSLKDVAASSEAAAIRYTLTRKQDGPRRLIALADCLDQFANCYQRDAQGKKLEPSSHAEGARTNIRSLTSQLLASQDEADLKKLSQQFATNEKGERDSELELAYHAAILSVLNPIVLEKYLTPNPKNLK